MSFFTDEDFRKFRDYVRLHTGIHFTDAKREELMRIVMRKSAEAGHPTARTYYKALHSPRADPELEERLVRAVTVGETYFFRYKEQWRLLESSLLPELIRRKREQGSRYLRLWSAGCSTGEEPYSLAITLTDLLGDLTEWRVFIVATDINPDYLQRARAGIYARWSFRSTPREKVARYFRPHADRFQVIKQVRDMVVFAAFNLATDECPLIAKGIHDMDLILCRNVLIYFDQDRIGEISQRLGAALVEGGYLLLGHSEPMHLVTKRLRQVSERGLIFFQRPVTTQALHAKPSVPRAVPVPAAASPAPTADDPLESARALFATGRGLEAVDLLLPLARSGTRHPDFLVLLAEIYAGTGQYDEARAWADRLLLVDGLDPDAYRVHSMISEATGKLDEALDYARKGLFLDPDSVLLLYQLGGLYRRRGEARKADNCYRRVMALVDPLSDDAMIGRGEPISVLQLKNAVKALLR